MKKFEFSLSHMRDYKERLLDEELGTLQRLKNERDEIAEKIERLKEEFRALSEKSRKAQEKGTTINEIRKYAAQQDNIRMQLRDLEKALAGAEQLVERQMQVVLAANQEVSKLDKLEERQLEEYRHQLNKAEEDRVDEFVAQSLCRSGGAAASCPT